MLSKTKNFAVSTFKFFALVNVFVITLAVANNFINPRAMDFISFWAAGRLTLAGDPSAAFDIDAHLELQRTVVTSNGLLPFANPPPFLLILTPFAALPFALATLCWVMLTYALYILAARRLAPNAGWIGTAFPPVLINGIIAQNGLLTGSLFMSGMALLKNHPFRAGLVLGCLVIKPHLGILLPLALALGGYWRTFAGAATSSVGLLAIGLLALGIEAYEAFLKQLPLFASVAAEGLAGWHKMASVYASLRLLGATPAVAWTVHILIAGGAALSAGLAWRSEADLYAKGAILASASVLISPYIYLYDTALLIFPFIWLLRDGERWQVLVALWCIPLLVALQNWVLNDLTNPAPLLPIAMIILIYIRVHDIQPKNSG